MQCRNGHLCCARCLGAIRALASSGSRERCPVCRDPGGVRYRCLAGEQVLRILGGERLECGNEGCTQVRKNTS